MPFFTGRSLTLVGGISCGVVAGYLCSGGVWCRVQVTFQCMRAYLAELLAAECETMCMCAGSSQ